MPAQAGGARAKPSAPVPDLPADVFSSKPAAAQEKCCHARESRQDRLRSPSVASESVCVFSTVNLPHVAPSALGNTPGIRGQGSNGRQAARRLPGQPIHRLFPAA